MNNNPASSRFRINAKTVRDLLREHSQLALAKPDGTTVLSFECNVDGGTFCNVFDAANPSRDAPITKSVAEEIVTGIGGWKMVEGAAGNRINFECEQNARGIRCKLNRGSGWIEMAVG